MVIALPESPEAFKEASWQEILPYYDDLAARPLDRETVEAWLADWSSFESLLAEAKALANFRYSGDTANPDFEAAQLRFGTEISPQAQEQRVRLQARLVGLGYERPDIETMLRRVKNEMDLFREPNVPLQGELAKLATEWAKVNGAMTVQWEGEEKTPAQLLPYLRSTDRNVRERAFRLRAQPYIEQHDTLAGLWDRMYDLREQVSRNAGFKNFRDYAHQEKNRFDYTPDDCLRFHEAVETAVLPAIKQILDRRQSQMGVDRLRPWDLAVDPKGRDALKPFDSTATLIDRSAQIFGHVDPDFRGYFQRMDEARLLDLDNRKGKAPGAFCDDLPFSKMPLIVMNAVGIEDDIRTLLHESGHAFHSFEAAKLPLVFQREYGAEMAEVASMSMELLAGPYIGKDSGGYYSDADARRSRKEHLEGIVLFFPHCASVDAFQHWAYTNEEGRDVKARDQKWLELRRRFEGDSVDWNGLDAERIARWYQQPHFFAWPFYYIEYGLAQLGALQVWRNSLRNQADAVRKYREALALGGTRSLPELYKAAGARLIFDRQGMHELISVVEEELEKLAD